MRRRKKKKRKGTKEWKDKEKEKKDGKQKWDSSREYTASDTVVEHHLLCTCGKDHQRTSWDSSRERRTKYTVSDITVEHHLLCTCGKDHQRTSWDSREKRTKYTASDTAAKTTNEYRGTVAERRTKYTVSDTAAKTTNEHRGTVAERRTKYTASDTVVEHHLLCTCGKDHQRTLDVHTTTAHVAHNWCTLLYHKHKTNHTSNRIQINVSQETSQCNILHSQQTAVVNDNMPVSRLQ